MAVMRMQACVLMPARISPSTLSPPSNREVRSYLASGCSLDRHAYSLCPHFGKRIPQVRPEFLPDPDHRPVMLSQGGDKPVGRLDEPLPRGRSPALKKVIDHVDHQKGGGFHARSVADRWRGRHGSSDAGSGRTARTSDHLSLDWTGRNVIL